MDWLIVIKIILFAILICHYGLLANYLLEHNRLKKHPDKALYMYGQPIKWWWFIPGGFFFFKDQYVPKCPKINNYEKKEKK
jgi:hypothetical protein